MGANTPVIVFALFLLAAGGAATTVIRFWRSSSLRGSLPPAIVAPLAYVLGLITADTNAIPLSFDRAPVLAAAELGGRSLALCSVALVAAVVLTRKDRCREL
ncbi:hypothetical protein [Pseudonocardia oroxyli]|uniref:Uncharacterized protein n=1 Tax=Pseudonocardia oroxyli TaxID=366584 RepID=A0A1G8EET9_PSEOR|nr:hypothetical protein [Pseudonocardia oroxyli]SDH68397.1 hypothetical protein SAMN05216377_1356 [Pseudonocardia oroxyli]